MATDPSPLVERGSAATDPSPLVERGSAATESKRRGRPAGNPDTRDRILDAALESFATKGFQGTSLRRVAADVGVDDSTVRHHFGDKVGLLLSALRISLDPRDLIPAVTGPGREGLGPRLLATALKVYESRMGEAVKQALAAHPEAAGMLAEVLMGQLERQGELLFPELSARERQERLAVVQAVMAGVGVSRLFLGVGPLAELPSERVVALLGPVLQAALDGRLDGRPTATPRR